MQSAGFLRDKLHQYIDVADEQKLQAIYVFLENEMEKQATYSTEEIALFYSRRKSYLAGEGKNYSVEESVNRIRQSRIK